MIKITPNKLSGELNSVSSKSFAHRALICAAFADDETQIFMPDICDDVAATVDCLKKLGAVFERKEEYICVFPIDYSKKKLEHNEMLTFDVCESGSTLRFILPVAMSVMDSAKFISNTSLAKRPLVDLMSAMKSCKVEFSKDTLPFVAKNRFLFSDISIGGNVTSQYISGLLLSAPLQNNDLKINIDGKITSRPYVDITLQIMRDFGVEINEDYDGFSLEKNSKYISPKIYNIEGDFSSSAFFLVAGTFSDTGVELCGLTMTSLQGDKKILNILKDFGADVHVSGKKVKVSKNKSHPILVDAENIPDLVPVLAVLACGAKGKSVLKNVERLRYKESNRIQTTIGLINSLGGYAYEEGDSIIIDGKGKLSGGVVKTQSDHRIAMSGAIASIICSGDVFIDNEKVVSKSYVGFFEDFCRLGGKYVFFNR